jgi:lipopolysaccharide transport system ATP-binding protein
MPASHHPPAAISVESLGKTFRTWASPAQRLIVPVLLRSANALRRVAPGLSQRLTDATRGRMHVHEALHDVSFSLQPGEALGVIGLNGSGKSTLLQIIAGVLPPSTGTVATRGRVAALLELGSGFNPELTGRENIHINAAILGMTPAQTEAVMPSIIAFADIGDYIEQPVKTYSSGMALRLAFSVQVHIEPDILIVDEALAVGDAAFQAKAMTRIQEILSSGTTLLFVGHDLNALRAFCQRAILLERGRMALLGEPGEVIEEYLFRVHARATEEQAGASGRLQRTTQGFDSAQGSVAAVRLQGAGEHVALRYDQPLRVEVDYRVDPTLADAACIVDILDERGVPLSGRRIRLDPGAHRGEPATLVLTFRTQLAHGLYRVRVRLVEAPVRDDLHTRVLCRYDGGSSFEVVDRSLEAFSGLFPLPCDVERTA